MSTYTHIHIITYTSLYFNNKFMWHSLTNDFYLNIFLFHLSFLLNIDKVKHKAVLKLALWQILLSINKFLFKIIRRTFFNRHDIIFNQNFRKIVFILTFWIEKLTNIINCKLIELLKLKSLTVIENVQFISYFNIINKS